MTRLMNFHKTKTESCHRTPFGQAAYTRLCWASLSSRASRVMGPISRHRIADILPHMKRVSRASRDGLLFGFLRILCKCTEFFTLQRTITLDVLDARMSLTPSFITTCPRMYNIFVSFWRHSTILPPRTCLFHDFISWVFLWSLQYGIVVLGFLDAFVYAHLKHRLSSANAGNFGECLTGRVRFMTAITPAYAHAYQTICLAMHFLGVPHHTLRLPKPKSRYPYLPNDRSITRELGNDYHGWAIFSDGGTRVVDGEIFAGWCVISRLPRGLIFILFCPRHYH